MIKGRYVLFNGGKDGSNLRYAGIEGRAPKKDKDGHMKTDERAVVSVTDRDKALEFKTAREAYAFGGVNNLNDMHVGRRP